MMPKKFYIAGNFGERSRLLLAKVAIEALGHTVVSSWLTANPSPFIDEEQQTAVACRDLDEIASCDALLLDTYSENHSMGREVEFGFALANGKPCFVVGERRNVFHQLAALQFDNWWELVTVLKRSYGGDNQ